MKTTLETFPYFDDETIQRTEKREIVRIYVAWRKMIQEELQQLKTRVRIIEGEPIISINEILGENQT